jgi:hypothetical protein
MEKKDHTVKAEPHHRRPRSLGGSSSPYNVSFVSHELHSSWHILFGNMNVYEICNFINNIKYKPENIYIVCEFINGDRVTMMGGQNHSKDVSKISLAWHALFREMKFEEIISYINNVWLDPSYHLYIKSTGT